MDSQSPFHSRATSPSNYEGKARDSRVGFDLENMQLVPPLQLAAKSGTPPINASACDYVPRPASSSILRSSVSEGRSTPGSGRQDRLNEILMCDSRRVVAPHTVTPAIGESNMHIMASSGFDRRCVESGKLPSFVEGISSISGADDSSSPLRPSSLAGRPPIPDSPDASTKKKKKKGDSSGKSARKKGGRRRSSSKSGSRSRSLSGSKSKRAKSRSTSIDSKRKKSGAKPGSRSVSRGSSIVSSSSRKTKPRKASKGPSPSSRRSSTSVSTKSRSSSVASKTKGKKRKTSRSRSASSKGRGSSASSSKRGKRPAKNKRKGSRSRSRSSRGSSASSARRKSGKKGKSGQRRRSGSSRSSRKSSASKRKRSTSPQSLPESRGTSPFKGEGRSRSPGSGGSSRRSSLGSTSKGFSREPRASLKTRLSFGRTSMLYEVDSNGMLKGHREKNPYPGDGPSSGRGRKYSLPSGGRGGKGNGKKNDRRKKKAVNPTEVSLKSINYSSFNSLKGKARKSKMMSEFMNAFLRGLRMLEDEWAEEMASYRRMFREELFEPQQREILRLGEFIKFLRKDCHEKLEFAASVTNNVLDGVEELVRRAQEAGVDLCSHLDVFKTTALYDDPRTVNGEPMPEVRGQEEGQGADIHPRAEYMNEAEKERATRSAVFFGDTLDILRRDRIKFDVPLAIPCMDLAPEYFAQLDEELQVYKAKRATEATVVKTRLEKMTDSVASMLERLNKKNEDYRTKIAAIQRALDEGSTHQKLASDFLLGTIEKNAIETESALSIVHGLDYDLRSRMDLIEGNMKRALEELLHASADLCVDHLPLDDSILQLKKEDAMFVFTSRLERGVIEHAALVREAQTVMMNLWRNRFIAGREEKTNLFHRNVPSQYTDMLQECDRDTLIRMLHLLSLQSHESSACLIGALDEYQYYLRDNPAEARAVKENAAELRVVKDLLRKLKEEGCIQRNPHQVSSDLSEMVQDLVNRYNEYINFNEKYARAEARLNEELLQPSRPAFFDSATVLPIQDKDKADIPKLDKVKCPYNACLYPAPQPTFPKKPAQEIEPSHSVPQTVSMLSRAYPSAPSVPGKLMSSVGDGRWHGQAAVPRDDNVVAEFNTGISSIPRVDLFSQTVPSYSTKPTLPARKFRRTPALTVAMDAERRDKELPRPPGPPLRKGLAQHVMQAYHGSAEELLNGTTPLVDPRDIRKNYESVEFPFIQRQRDLSNAML